MNDRDYCTEMRQIIDQATATGGYIPGVVADEITAKLRATDRDLLAGWLDAQAARFIREAIGERDRAIRARARHQASRGVFAAAVEAHSAGDSAALGGYLAMPFSLADGSHQALGKLKRDDLLYVAGTYERRENENAFYKSVIRALAKKVGKGAVEDHFTEGQLAAMFESVAV